MCRWNERILLTHQQSLNSEYFTSEGNKASFSTWSIKYQSWTAYSFSCRSAKSTTVWHVRSWLNVQLVLGAEHKRAETIFAPQLAHAASAGFYISMGNVHIRHISTLISRKADMSKFKVKPSGRWSGLCCWYVCVVSLHAGPQCREWDCGGTGRCWTEKLPLCTEDEKHSGSYVTKVLSTTWPITWNISDYHYKKQRPKSRCDFYWLMYACKNKNVFSFLQCRSYCKPLWINKCNVVPLYL